MAMILRSYQKGDCPALVRLFQQTVHRVNAADYSPEQLAAWAPEDVDLAAWEASFLAHDTLIAEEDGEIWGFSDLGEQGYLDRLYVRWDRQGRRVATTLCDALEELARQHHIQMPMDQLLVKAEAFAIRAGGRSPRVAKQFIEQCEAGVQK